MAALEHGTDSIRLVGVAGHAQSPREAEQIVEFDADDAVVEIVGILPSSPSMKRQIKTAAAPRLHHDGRAEFRGKFPVSRRCAGDLHHAQALGGGGGQFQGDKKYIKA